MNPRVIDAEFLLLSLVARRANPRCRWAVLSDGRWSPSCGRRYGDFKPHKTPSLLGPMQRGNLHEAILRQRLTQGLPSIRKTFGVGLRAILAEPRHLLPGLKEPAP